MTHRCPFCGVEIGVNADLHISKCPLNPDNSELIQDTLHDLSELGVMPPIRAYDAAAADQGMPQSRLLRRILGSWNQVARWCGLIPFSERKYIKLETARFALIDLAKDGVGPSPNEYLWYSPDGAASIEYLRQHIGPWPKVMEWAGLKCPPVVRYRRSDFLGPAKKFVDLDEEHRLALEPAPLEVISVRRVFYRDRTGRKVLAWATKLR